MGPNQSITVGPNELVILTRLTALFAAEEHIEVEATWGIYQPMITAYREPERKQGRDLMSKLIESVSHGVPAALTELRRLGPTLTNRAADVLAYFDRPGTSNGPTEAINGRLEHLPDRHSASATSPTTSPDHSWRAADSDPGYTLDCEEPLIHSVHKFQVIPTTARRAGLRTR